MELQISIDTQEDYNINQKFDLLLEEIRSPYIEVVTNDETEKGSLGLGLLSVLVVILKSKVVSIGLVQLSKCIRTYLSENQKDKIIIKKGSLKIEVPSNKVDDLDSILKKLL